jgi:hypothetical protein
MKFSVFQISRKGGREKNEDRMGYCYTRESGLFVLADGMGGHPEGEVAAQLALQTISALYQREARPVVKDVKRVPHVGLMAAHHQIMRYASEKGMLDTPRTTVVAAMLQGTRPPGCTAATRACTSCATAPAHAHARPFVPGAASARRILHGPINRNILFTCLGSPTKPVFDVSAPLHAAARRQDLLCSDGCGAWSTRDIVHTLSSGKPVSEPRPTSSKWRCATAARTATTSRHRARVGNARRVRVHPAACPPTASATACSPPPSRPACPPTREIDDLDEDAIERSIAEINEAIRRSAARKT